MSEAFELEKKFCTPGQQLTVTDGTEIAGYASLFGAQDQGGDVVEAGAYAASLAELKAAGRRVTATGAGHDRTERRAVPSEPRARRLPDGRNAADGGRAAPATTRRRPARRRAARRPRRGARPSPPPSRRVGRARHPHFTAWPCRFSGICCFLADLDQRQVSVLMFRKFHLLVSVAK